MKTSNKIALFTSIGLIVLGLSTCAVAAAYGGVDGAVKICETSNVVNFTPNSWSINLSHLAKVDFDDNHDINHGSADHTFNVDDFSSISIKLGASELTLEPCKGDEVNINIDGIKKSQCYIDKDILYVIASDNASGEISIEFPEDKELKDVVFDIGAGEIDATSISCDTMTVIIGAGDADLDNITVHDTLNTNVGAGEISFDSSTVNNMTAEVGLGNFEYSGVITNTLNAQCGLGNMDFDLDDKEEMHNYHCKVDLGNVNINGHSISGSSNNINQNSDVTSTFTIDCGLGNVNIDFD